MSSGSAFLDRILATKRDSMSAVSSVERRETHAAALQAVGLRTEKRLFLKALQRKDRINIIAEIKRSSPSAGAIHQDADAVAIASTYERAGAAAISVLTESEYFRGSLQDLADVATRVKTPLLRKDFTVDRHQIYEAAVAGASAILLIVAALSDAELADLRTVAEQELGLDALVEAHSAREAERALACGASIVGVNNRNLQTLEISLETSRELARFIVNDQVFISESGIRTASDIDALRELGYNGFLVGETLMRATDPAAALRALCAGGQQ